MVFCVVSDQKIRDGMDCFKLFCPFRSSPTEKVFCAGDCALFQIKPGGFGRVKWRGCGLKWLAREFDL